MATRCSRASAGERQRAPARIRSAAVLPHQGRLDNHGTFKQEKGRPVKQGSIRRSTADPIYFKDAREPVFVRLEQALSRDPGPAGPGVRFLRCMGRSCGPPRMRPDQTTTFAAGVQAEIDRCEGGKQGTSGEFPNYVPCAPPANEVMHGMALQVDPRDYTLRRLETAAP